MTGVACGEVDTIVGNGQNTMSSIPERGWLHRTYTFEKSINPIILFSTMGY